MVKKIVELVLSVALGIAMLNVAAAAQKIVPTPARVDPRFEYAIYDPTQSTGLLRPVAWDDRHRCDGDHDRDDRHCYGYRRYREGDRYRDRAYLRGSGYSGNAPVSVPHCSYVRDGRWHRDKGHCRDRDR